MKEQAALCCFQALQEEKCYDFLLPCVRADLEDIPAETGNRLAPSAVRDMETLLAERLQILYAGILITRLIRLIKRHDIAQALHPPVQITGEMRQAARDLKQELEERGIEDLHREYPLLSGYEAPIRENYILAMRELFARYSVHEREIADRFFDGKPPERILGLKASGADMHRGGRCVIHIITDTGDCYYKPHDCTLDVFYRRVTERWFSDCTQAPEVISGDGYAFVSALIRKPLEAPSDAALYYRHFGMLTAVLHGLGSNDMHAENLLPCGDKPCIVDMESVVSTLKRPPSGKDADPEERFQGLVTSLMRVGFLPMRLHKAGMVSPLYRGDAGEAALPFYGETSYTIEGREADFLEGFRDGYRRMMLHRDEIRRMLPSCADALVRIITFNTVYYARCRARLYSEEALRSPELTRKLFADLALPFTWYGKEVNLRQTEHEAAALREGDIPYFCTVFRSHDLYGNGPEEPVEKEYLSISAEEYTLYSLARLSEEDLLFEEALLKRSFAHVPLDVDVPPEEADWPIAGTDRSLREARAAALLTGRETLAQIRADRLRTADGLSVWLGHASTVRSPAGAAAQLAGAMPVAFRILACPRLPDLQEDAARLIHESVADMGKALEKILKLDPPYLKNQISLGLGEGLGQILLSLRLAAVYLPETKAARLAGEYRDKLIASLMEKDVWESDKRDVLEGLSGLLMGASSPIGAEEARPQSRDLARLICGCADSLSAAPQQEEPDAFTGNAGIGAALAYAWRHTGNPTYAEGAVQAFTRVKEQYSRSVNGWPESSAVLKWVGKRAPKAAGIGLCALQALAAMDAGSLKTGAEAPDAAVIREVLELSLESALDERFLYWNDSLYRGNALTVLFLTRAAEALQDPQLLKRAGDILAAMTARKDRFGAYHVMEKGVRNSFDISFPEGSPGIAYAALVFEEAAGKGVSG